MKISIVVCTYNRGRSLEKTLQSLNRLNLPEENQVELILVDNNSKDDTKKIVSDFSPVARFPVRYVFESRQGLSHARNRGVAEAAGEILAFTDDDVLVDENWLANISDCFRREDIACAGGKIFPIWEVDPPKWLTSELYKFLAILDLGNDPVELREDSIFGANLIIRSAMFEKYGVFNPDVGRTDGKLYAGEESEFIERMLVGGERVFYLPNLIVHHYIPKNRINKKYFRKWVKDNSELLADQLGVYTKRNIMGIPFYIIKRLIISFFDYLVACITLNKMFYRELLLLKYLVFVGRRLRSC